MAAWIIGAATSESPSAQFFPEASGRAARVFIGDLGVAAPIMKIRRSHAPWIVFVALATAGSALLYVANFFPRLLPFHVPLPALLGDVPPSRNTVGGTPLGLIFGSVAFLIFLFASALGIRKKQRTWPIGSVQFWLKAHIWLTVFTIPLVLFHCGFHSGGAHTSALLLLYGIVMGSGFFGIAMQQFMPRVMTERLPREVVFEQIPHLRGLLLESAMKMRESLARSQPVGTAAAGLSAAEDSSVQMLVRFLDHECLPYLAAKRGERHALGVERTAAGIFGSLRLNVDDQWKPRVEAMQDWCAERRLMDLQTKLQHWLHGWLLIHVPSSVALLVFTAWHACVAVRFLLIG